MIFCFKNFKYLSISFNHFFFSRTIVDGEQVAKTSVTFGFLGGKRCCVSKPRFSFFVAPGIWWFGWKPRIASWRSTLRRTSHRIFSFRGKRFRTGWELVGKWSRKVTPWLVESLFPLFQMLSSFWLFFCYWPGRSIQPLKHLVVEVSHLPKQEGFGTGETVCFLMVSLWIQKVTIF